MKEELIEVQNAARGIIRELADIDDKTKAEENILKRAQFLLSKVNQLLEKA